MYRGLLLLGFLAGCAPQVVKVPVPEPVDIPDELMGPIDRPYVLWYDTTSYAGPLVCLTAPHAVSLRDYIIRLETRVDGFTAFASETTAHN